VRRLIAAQWIRIRRHWLGRMLLILLLAVLAVQLDGRVDRLAFLNERIQAAEENRLDDAMVAMFIESYRVEAEALQENLSFPSVIGYGVRLATDFGWFFLVALVAVVGGEDCKRGTLRPLLARGAGRGRYLAAGFLSLWLASAVGVAAVTLLSAALGPGLHAQVSDAPLALAGLGEALLGAFRVWLAGAAFIAATLFWAVLARRPGPALGVSIVLQFIGFGLGTMLPFVALTGSLMSRLPAALTALIRLHSITISYGADIFLHWGIPIVKPAGAVGAIVMADSSMLPVSPWRALAFLLGYTALFLAWTAWILHRRDVTHQT